MREQAWSLLQKTWFDQSIAADFPAKLHCPSWRSIAFCDPGRSTGIPRNRFSGLSRARTRRSDATNETTGFDPSRSPSVNQVETSRATRSHLYQDLGRYLEAQEVFRAGVDRGFAPAMLYLASSYRNSPEWPRRREESLTLLERGSAAGDLSARRYLAGGMTRGWFGLRQIPSGIRLLFRTAEQMVDLIDDEIGAAQTGTKARPGFLGRLRRGMVASQT